MREGWSFSRYGDSETYSIGPNRVELTDCFSTSLPDCVPSSIQGAQSENFSALSCDYDKIDDTVALVLDRLEEVPALNLIQPPHSQVQIQLLYEEQFSQSIIEAQSLPSEMPVDIPATLSGAPLFEEFEFGVGTSRNASKISVVSDLDSGVEETISGAHVFTLHAQSQVDIPVSYLTRPDLYLPTQSPVIWMFQFIMKFIRL